MNGWIRFACLPCLAAACISEAKTATIRVDGWFEVAEGRQTMDWLLFEVLSPGTITVQAGIMEANSETSWLVLGQLLGESGFLSDVRLTTSRTREITTHYDQVELTPGRWVAGFAPITDSRDSASITDASWDKFFGRGFPEREEFGYNLRIRGDVRAIEWREGALDGTFAVTSYPVPEPSTACFLGAGALFRFSRRRRHC